MAASKEPVAIPDTKTKDEAIGAGRKFIALRHQTDKALEVMQQDTRLPLNVRRLIMQLRAGCNLWRLWRLQNVIDFGYKPASN